MLSICIPIYNFNASQLIETLLQQTKNLPNPSEIILIDDASFQFKDQHKKYSESCSYIELPENIGRARIRNLFLKHAKYDYLLFLDCDSTIDNPSFILNYLEIIQGKPNVVCGGSIYDYNNPKKENLLRLKNGFFRESQPASERNKNPYKSFLTNNFLIKKEILNNIKFDERLSQYGHEDTLFGYLLKSNNIPIIHLDNVVVNGDIDLNDKFLEKTKNSIENLVNILNYIHFDPDFIQSISLLNTYYKLKNIDFIISFTFYFLEPLLKTCFSKGIVNLYAFDYYKLGTLNKIVRKQKSR